MRKGIMLAAAVQLPFGAIHEWKKAERPAKAFFRKAIKGQQLVPQTITLDGYAASHRAVRELNADGSLAVHTKLRSSNT